MEENRLSAREIAQNELRRPQRLIEAADRLAEAVRAWAGCERCSDTDICREDIIPILDALDSYRRLRETMNG